jgi:hypothetical protein
MNRSALVACLLTASLATVANAAAPAAAAGDADKKHAEYFARSDMNSDGVISKDEFLAKTLKRFSEIDSNRDGKINPVEMKAYREVKKAERAKKKAAKKAAKQAAAAAKAPAAAPVAATKPTVPAPAAH